MKALLLENVHPEAAIGAGCRRHRGDALKGALDEDELAAALPGVQLLGIRSKTQVTADILKTAPDLLAVGAFCIGTNQIDTEWPPSSGWRCSTRRSRTRAVSWSS